jgi:hydrogenase/urease accessory protein HupE
MPLILILFACCLAPHLALADSFGDDMAKIRELLMENAKDNSFWRGMLLPMFQPMFLASMLCFGLWAGQLRDKLTVEWAIPITLLVGTVIGAFIAAYHPDWQPDFSTLQDSDEKLPNLNSTEVAAVLGGLAIGMMVGLQTATPGFLALVFSSLIGLAYGLSQTGLLGDDFSNADRLAFWTGFGTTGILMNIFGLGCHSFLTSVNASQSARVLGFMTVLFAFYRGMRIF